MSVSQLNAHAIARRVRAGECSAREIVEDCLARIEKINPQLRAFTDVTTERALRRADVIDASQAHRAKLGPLAGVPFAVKNMFDIAGFCTRAGSKIERDAPAAKADAPLIQRLEAAGAILVGGLNMGEYAYDFTGENHHDGSVCNPHDLGRMAGGSSSGCGAAVAAGLVPLALGSDTNGSIRVPSAFCGLFGLKPTYGRLTRTGTYPFVGSLDHLGPFATTTEDLSLAYDAMLGDPDGDASVAARPKEMTAGQLDQGIKGLRIGVATGYFQRDAEPGAIAALQAAAQALGAPTPIDISRAAETARAAAQLISASEGAALHLPRLQRRPGDFDRIVRDRLLAGLTIPATWIERAQHFRRWFHDQMLATFERLDVILAPSTPCSAPLLGQTNIQVGDRTLPLRPHIGLYTQPISFIGLPVCAVPVWVGTSLPYGVQIITGPWQEAMALRVARELEHQGIARFRAGALRGGS